MGELSGHVRFCACTQLKLQGGSSEKWQCHAAYCLHFKFVQEGHVRDGLRREVRHVQGNLKNNT